VQKIDATKGRWMPRRCWLILCRMHCRQSVSWKMSSHWVCQSVCWSVLFLCRIRLCSSHIIIRMLPPYSSQVCSNSESLLIIPVPTLPLLSRESFLGHSIAC
jgi:hypothetical protein